MYSDIVGSERVTRVDELDGMKPFGDRNEEFAFYVTRA